MQLYLIRHAMSEWQEGKSKSSNSDISELGKKQITFLNDYIKCLMEQTKEDYVLLSSPLKRSLQTIQILDEEYEIMNQLKEAKFHVASILPKFEDISLYKKHNVENDEYITFKNELYNLLKKITQDTKQKNIFMFTHAGVIKTLLRILHDNDAIDYIINNCSITKISWYRNRWTINYINDTSFLSEEYVT